MITSKIAQLILNAIDFKQFQFEVVLLTTVLIRTVLEVFQMHYLMLNPIFVPFGIYTGSMGSATGGARGPWPPQILLEGASNAFGPPRF